MTKTSQTDDTGSRESLLAERDLVLGSSGELTIQPREPRPLQPPPAPSFHPQGHDVSLRTLPAFVSKVEATGGSLEALLRGTTLSRTQVANTRGWISWQDYVTIQGNLSTLLSEEQLQQLGVEAFESTPFRFFRMVSWAIPSQLDFYRWAFRQAYGANGLFIRCVETRLTPVRDGMFEAILRLPDGATFPSEFVTGMQSTLAHLPTLFGNPTATTTYTLDGPLLVYALALQSDDLSWSKRLRRWFSRLLSTRSTANELKQTHELLLAQNHALKTQLEDLQRSESARRVLEDRLRQSQKMEAIGRLAGSVAHDFNSYLTIILSHCDFLLEEDLRDAERRDVQNIQEAGLSAARLTSQLLTFGRQQVLELGPLDVNDTVDSMRTMLSTLSGPSVVLETDLDPDGGRVEANISQIQQVLINLVGNARDAMKEKGGSVRIQTRRVSVSPEEPRQPPSEHSLVLSVSDQGCGMDAETRSRVFEPFFTTKPEGQGTGLGLATVYGITQQLGGTIELQSEVALGTTVSISLPLLAEDLAS